MSNSKSPAAQAALALRLAMVADGDCECCGGNSPSVKLAKRHGRGRKRALCADCR